MAARTRSRFDPRPFVARYVRALLDDARRLARAPYATQLKAASLADAERSHITRALEACDGNKSDAARLIQIDRRSLQRKALRKSRKK